MMFVRMIIHRLTFYAVATILLTTTMDIRGTPSSGGGMVAAQRMIRFIFNNGNIPRQYNECSEYEYQRYIDPIFSKINITMIPTISNVTTPNATTSIGHARTRRLRQVLPRRTASKKYPGKCRDNCAGMARGTCRATDCVGYRRRRQQYRSLTSEGEDVDTDDDADDDEDHDDEQQLQYSITCEEQINDIHYALDQLIRRTGSSYSYNNGVSTSCQRFLSKSKRKAECYDEIIYGEIMSFTFWNMNYARGSSSSQQPPYSSRYSYSYGGSYQPRIKIKENVTADGLNVCDNIPLNVEANVNSCVDTVHFKIQGWTNNSTNVIQNMTLGSITSSITNSITSSLTKTKLMKYERIDDQHPMYLFNSTTYASTKGGRYLLPGSYTLTATPDQFRSKKKTLRFNVIKC